MKLDQIFPEPLLQFGGGKESPDIRHGLAAFGPVDSGTPLHRSSIRLGLVGTLKTIERFTKWMLKCGHGIKSEDYDNQNLHPAFPGLSLGRGLECEFSTAPMWTNDVTDDELRKEMTSPGPIKGLAELYYGRIRACFALSAVRPDVVVCLPPESVRKLVKPRLGDDCDDEEAEDRDGGDNTIDFHDYLKALCLQDQFAIQLIWPRTYEEGEKGVQDEATRAWNLFTGIFYKAGGIPWKLAKAPGANNTCYVGVSFARREDGGYMHSSLTQVFNDKGEGTILRGGLARKSEEDKEVHLERRVAFSLLSEAIENFMQANSQKAPDRVVVHKSSGFDHQETAGFNDAAEGLGVRFKDFMAINRCKMRLFRKGAYPPLRGTHVILDEMTSILYTRGSVPFYRKYPGAYVPTTLQIRQFQTDRTMSALASEILALTKLNWNKTQFDSLYPITLQGSRRIGEVYRWCPNPPADAVSYALFM